MENINNSSNGINKLLEICVNTLDMFAPHKKKRLTGKQYAIHEQKLS